MFSEQGHKETGKQLGSRRKMVRRIIFGILGVCIVGCVSFAVWCMTMLQPVHKGAGQMVQIDVQKGDTLQQIATVLESRGLIRNAWTFRVYVHFYAHGEQIKAGHYALQKGLSISSILTDLEQGNTTNTSVTVTFPEGFTVKQMAERLAANGICSESAFLAEEQHGQFDESFLKSIGSSPLIKYRLEGYLFPDTYDFERGESPREVIDAMLRDFARHVNAGVYKVLTQRHLSLAVAITEASLIEREAKVESERPVIASVINNRLAMRPPMPLQIDATIEYILGHQNIVTDADLKVQDPYNTYLHTGLPPGPIANPGMASIEAVLHPAATNYLFYVAKNDGSGEHYFAHTYSQQLANEVKSEANLRSHS